MYINPHLTVENVTALYKEIGNVTKVGKYCGCSGNCVSRFMDKHNLPRAGRYVEPKINLDDQMVRSLYLDENHSMARIARKVGCSESVVRKNLMAQGIKRERAW